MVIESESRGVYYFHNKFSAIYGMVAVKHTFGLQKKGLGCASHILWLEIGKK